MFGRVVRLQIVSSSGQSVEIEGLRVRFRVRRAPGKTDGAAVDVWGLAQDSYAQLGRLDTVTRVIAGYEDSGVGTVLEGTTVRDSLDRPVLDGEVVTSWQLAEGGRVLSAVQLSQSWRGSVAAVEVLDAVCSALGVSRLSQALPRVVTYATGYVLSGSPRAALTAIAGDLGCRWAIHGGRLSLIPMDGSAARVRAVVLAADSGLIDWPEAADKGRVKCKALLQPGMLPGDSYRIEGRMAGDYVVEELEHHGDSGWSDEFFTLITGRPRRV